MALRFTKMQKSQTSTSSHDVADTSPQQTKTGFAGDPDIRRAKANLTAGQRGFTRIGKTITYQGGTETRRKPKSAWGYKITECDAP